jgi:hypothetical protein
MASKGFQTSNYIGSSNCNHGLMIGKPGIGLLNRASKTSRSDKRAEPRHVAWLREVGEGFGTEWESNWMRTWRMVCRMYEMMVESTVE